MKKTIILFVLLIVMVRINAMQKFVVINGDSIVLYDLVANQHIDVFCNKDLKGWIPVRCVSMGEKYVIELNSSHDNRLGTSNIVLEQLSIAFDQNGNSNYRIDTIIHIDGKYHRQSMGRTVEIDNIGIYYNDRVLMYAKPSGFRLRGNNNKTKTILKPIRNKTGIVSYKDVRLSHNGKKVIGIEYVSKKGNDIAPPSVIEYDIEKKEIKKLSLIGEMADYSSDDNYICYINTKKSACSIYDLAKQKDIFCCAGQWVLWVIDKSFK